MGLYKSIKSLFCKGTTPGNVKEEMINEVIGRFPLSRNGDNNGDQHKNNNLSYKDIQTGSYLFLSQENNSTLDSSMVYKCIYEFLEHLENRELRIILYKDIYENYSKVDQRISEIINTIQTNMFKKDNGKCILNFRSTTPVTKKNYLENIHVVYFNLIMFGNPLLDGIGETNYFKQTSLIKYDSTYISFRYIDNQNKSFIYKASLLNHVSSCFLLLLRSIYLQY